MLEFKHEVERWHKIKEFAEYLTKYAEFREMNAIDECAWYEWDQQSAEDYCSHPQIVEEPFQSKPLDGHSRDICWKCPHYEIITGIPASSELS